MRSTGGLVQQQQLYEEGEPEGKAFHLTVELRPNLHGHELWIMTVRMNSWIQAAEMSFLHKMAGFTLRDRWRSDIQKELGAEPLFLHVERNKLRWFGHLNGWAHGSLLRYWAHPTDRRPRTRWRDCTSHLTWERRLRISQEELEDVAGKKDALKDSLH